MALYRKYRPASFAEVVGQDQVTVPLSTALETGHINHAYLFSGPRGCGKTSSARILARSLNCVEGPTPHPCGKCDSCIALAPGGPGNLDVMELDAASHNGVDDMRELRERAIYAPAESRYRVFIIDEAHMITNQGANALLKIVEEPPAHLIFIFATTEPEKVIGTIRSRTHHYPFRLVAPLDMRQLIERIVADENVHVDPSVYPLVIRAGGGSPRDTLSILDQLLAGAGEDGLQYDEALPLLGVTDDSLLDDAVSALGTSDPAGLFGVVGKVIDSGHEPRRFTEDLLDRLRDLMVLASVPNAVDQGLVDAPADRARILSEQSSMFTPDQLARLAESLNNAYKDMSGATSQRLLLEIACARMLVAGSAAPAPVAPSPRAAAAAAVVSQASEVPEQAVPEPEKRRPEPRKPAKTSESVPEKTPETQTESSVSKPTPVPTPEPKSEQPPAPAKTPEQSPEPQSDSDTLELIRSRWHQIRRDISARNKVASIMVAEAQVLRLEGDTLILGHHTGALAQRINADSNNRDVVEAVRENVDKQLQVKCIIASGSRAKSEPKKAWQPPKKKEEKHTDWAEIINRRAETFSDGAPLPPEPPAPEPPMSESPMPASRMPEPEPEPVPPTQVEQEQEMVEAAAQDGELDTRDALAYAVELVEKELGATKG